MPHTQEVGLEWGVGGRRCEFRTSNDASTPSRRCFGGAHAAIIVAMTDPVPKLGPDFMRSLAWRAMGRRVVYSSDVQISEQRLLSVAAAALTAFVLGTCGGGGNGGGPTVPSLPTTPPAAGPTPEPPISASCERLPLGSASHVCQSEGARFFDEVVGAIATLQSERPEYFQGENVTNLGGYFAGLIRILDRKGLCAAYDGEELAVKDSNEFSEQYRVLASWGQIRRVYMTTCVPAVFPLARSNPAPSAPGCALPPSSEVACGRPAPNFLDDVEAAIDQVLKQKPELFDFDQTAPGTDGPLLKDARAYHLAVADALVARGFCSKFDGEEIQAKRSNEFSEHYDINYSDRYVRRGPGTFRSSCYPAAF